MELERAVFVGTFLGLLDRESLQAVDKLFYSQHVDYRSDAYNLSGLHDWEERARQKYFREGGSVLVAAAGGGREAIALESLGYEVTAFECHPDLVEIGNRLLESEGLETRIAHAPRDECPEFGKRFDGVVFGWGGYMLVQGREQRIRFLRQLRLHVEEGTPLLVSFFPRSAADARHLRRVAAIARRIRRVRRREPVEVGDDLVPNFVHFFAEDEMRAELHAGGFRMELFSSEEYGHAVAFAADIPPAG